jgi:hypothetical protein
MTGTNTNFEGFARLNSGDPTLGQHAPMQERIARPIREFNEAKSLFGAEPFDDPTDRWTGGCLEGCSAKAGSGSESTGL